MKLSTVALATAAAGAIGLGVLTVPAGAGSEPQLPEVSAEELVASVLTASPPAFGGTVEVVDGLGLPTLPGIEGESLLTVPETARVWSDGEGRGRLALPSHSGEQTVVEDGDTLWVYDSESRTATAVEHGSRPAPEPPAGDPAAAARAVVDAVRSTSTVTVDGTAEIAGRPAYDLVLTPAATERTLLREVRVAVDSETRMPLRLDVLTNGATEPALRIGFTDIEVGPQDAGLFTFTPPEGVTVERPDGALGGGWVAYSPLSGPAVQVVGDGWDTVLLGSVPPEALEMVAQVGRPASGAWGDGWVVQTAVGTVLVGSDGRVAAGAVPQQVLAEVLAR